MKQTVGISEMKIARDPEDVLVTYALGSCLGIAIYDPLARVGGMIHVMLPLSTAHPMKARDNPCMFVDTGVPRLFLEAYKAGARKERLLVSVAGGASLRGSTNDWFEIGKRNLLMLRKLLWRNGVLLQAEDVGGTHSRTMELEIRTGRVTISSNGRKWEL